MKTYLDDVTGTAFERKPLAEETVEVVSMERGGRIIVTRPADGPMYTIGTRYDGSVAADTRYGDEIEPIWTDDLSRVVGFRVTRRGDWWKRA